MTSINGVYDEYGVEWVVKPKDYASTDFNKLNRMGFKYIVLPRYKLSGRAAESVVQCADVVSQTRLDDCMKALES